MRRGPFARALDVDDLSSVCFGVHAATKREARRAGPGMGRMKGLGPPFAVVAALVAVGACGGKAETSQPSPVGTVSPPGPTGPVGGGGSGPSGPSAGVASKKIAEAYCGSFATCCSTSGQPPIDLIACQNVTTKVLLAGIPIGLSGEGTTSQSSLDDCVAAITKRVSSCSTEDALFGTDIDAFFGPSSVNKACTAFFPHDSPVGTRLSCSSSQPCADVGNTSCAVDECAFGHGSGLSCPPDCFDGLECVSGKCALHVVAGLDAKCGAPSDCAPGLVCHAGTCVPHRAAPGLKTITFSPYRVSAETCRAFQYL